MKILVLTATNYGPVDMWKEVVECDDMEELVRQCTKFTPEDYDDPSIPMMSYPNYHQTPEGDVMWTNPEDRTIMFVRL